MNTQLRKLFQQVLLAQTCIPVWFVTIAAALVRYVLKL